MKFFILTALLAAATALPYGSYNYGAEQQQVQEGPQYAKEEPTYATITRQEDVRNMDGSSQYSYASSDQITREESQYQKQIGSATGTAAQGYSSYIAPDGQKIETSWTADETGYHATGAHLPVAPPMPAEIAAMLPTLPQLTFEQLYGSPAVAAPSTYEAPKYDAPKYDAPKYDAPKYDAPKHEAPRYEAPKYDAPKYEAPRYEAPKVAEPKYEAPKYDAPKYDAPKYEAPRYEAPKVAEPKYEAPRVAVPLVPAPKYEAPRYQAPAVPAPAKPSNMRYY